MIILLGMYRLQFWFSILSILNQLFYDVSSIYEPFPSSLRQEPRQVIPDSPTYQSASIGEYEQENDYLSQNLPKQDQAYGDESPRYSPDY